MFAYDNLLGQVTEWKDKGSSAGHASNSNKKNSASGKGGSNKPPTTPRGAAASNANSPRYTATITKQSIPTLPTIHTGRSTSIGRNFSNGKTPANTPRKYNNIPLRPATTTDETWKAAGSDDDDGDDDEEGSTLRRSNNNGAAATGTFPGNDKKVKLSETVQQRLYAPRAPPGPRHGPPSDTAPDGTIIIDKSKHATNGGFPRNASFLRMEQMLKDREEKAKLKPGSMPFKSGGTRNVEWFKQLPIPPSMLERQEEITEKRKKDPKGAEENLVQRLYRFPDRPREPVAKPRPPLTEEEEAELVERLYVIRTYGNDAEEEEEHGTVPAGATAAGAGGGRGGEEDDDEIDIEDQIDRLYYQALEQQRRKREKLTAKQEKERLAMRTPRTIQTMGKQYFNETATAHGVGGSGVVMVGSGGAVVRTSSPNRTNSPNNGRHNNDCPNRGGAGAGSITNLDATNTGDDEEDEQGGGYDDPNKRSETEIKATVERLYDKGYYDRRTENAYRRSGYM